MAPEIRPTSSSSTPSARDRCTIEATSCAVNAETTSSFGSTPIIRSTTLAIQLRARITGDATRLIHTSGGPNHRAAAPASRRRGSSAPSRRAPRAGRPRAPARARKRSGAQRSSGTPSASSGPSRSCASAGSATTPRPVEHTVMPSCAQASISETCSIAHSTVLAPAHALLGERLDLRAPGGHDGELGADEEGVPREQQQADEKARPGAHSSSSDAVGTRRGHPDHVDAPAVHLLHPQRRPGQPTISSPTSGRRPSTVMTGRRGSRTRLVRHHAARSTRELVGAQGAGDQPRAPPPRATRRRPRVVLVGDVAHQLLDDVLERHRAGGAAVLVHDHRHLQPELAQLHAAAAPVASSRAPAARRP